MSTTKAQTAKDKGNISFKNGDFPSAIGHYTQAILEDPKDWTFPLNRAAAYLKLGKNEDAERDCTTVLTLNTSNVKAFFRRAQARRGLEKLAEAQEDLEQAISLDPSNQSVKTELSAIKDLLWKKAASEIVHPMRRRVPIKIIESASDETQKATVSVKDSRSKISSSSTHPSEKVITNHASPSHSIPTDPLAAPKSPEATATITPVPPSPQDSSKPKSSFQEAKRARNEKEGNISRVGGGIFRASGKNTIFTRSTTGGDKNEQDANPKDTKDAEGSPAPAWGADVHLGTATTTLFEFTRGWSRLSGSSVEEKFRYIMTVAPSSFPNMIQNSLEPPLLTGIFRTFHETLDELRVSSLSPSPSTSTSSSSPSSSSPAYLKISSLIAAVLRAFLNVRRIRIVVMFLSPGERKMMGGVAEDVFRHFDEGEMEGRMLRVQGEDVAEESRKALVAWRSMLK
ncbi:RNA polymerase II-associated protein 3 [Lentinula edodes]|uniref:RNA polymerase II-associated protein 3 n=1 Tax=Lentinula edodes TaxID=5353 RepID=A0A1Q3ERQ6_LENED|nr:RNA polymerase II-associated protein 3 [Lentinula edodes]